MSDDFKPFNLAEVYRNADAGIAQALQANMMVMQAHTMKRESDEEESLRTLARSSTSTDASGQPQFDLKSFTKGAYGINPMKGLAFEKTQREAEKVDLEKQNLQGQVDERRMKTAAERLKVMNEASTVPFLKYKELLEGGMADQDARAKVQPMYEAAVRNVATSGFFTPEQLQGMKIMQSQQFDPVLAETGMRQVLGAKDQLGEYWNKKNFGQRAEQHADSMKVQIRGQDITIRGQDLTDTRSRESLEQQGLEVKTNDDGTYNIIDKKTGTASEVLNKDGTPAQGKTNLTESQGKALGFGQRAVEAHNIISGLDQELGKVVAAKQGAGNVPLVGGLLETAINKGVSGGAQKYEQAQRDFINAVLRPESGATITPAEFDNAKKQYFPQIGDGKDVLKQKAEAREREIETLKAMAGPGAKKFPKIKKPGTAEPVAFASEEEAAAAAKAGKIKAGAKITVGGKPGTWQD